jgi:flagellar biosynthesis/type III secretory pathway chaperone
MISTPELPLGLPERLLEALDRELELLAAKRAEMEQLLAALARRDDAALERLLSRMEQGEREQSQADRDVERISSDLAAEVGCPVERPRLSELAAYLPPDLARALEDRRQALTSHLRQLRRKHMEMSMLLHECQKINRLLLECLLRESSGPGTYSANGNMRHRDGGGVMRAEL